jgi:hypothetical protein
MMKRFGSCTPVRMLLIALVLGLVGVFSSVNPAAAAPRMGCGWPSCNPARLSSTGTKLIVPPGGTAAYIAATFSSSVSYPTAETYAIFNGSSSAIWHGSNPLRATRITLSDTWRASGAAISVSFPSGVGISGSGNTATWSGGVNNTSRVTHYFSNIKFTGALYSVSESTTGTFQFGSVFFTVSASDSALI